jgi:hypothetical protein
MSKVDALRAMREAKYAARNSRAVGSPAAAPAGPPAEGRASAPKKKPEAAAEPAPAMAPAEQPGAAEPEQQAALCGHRNIGNKTCLRPAGHAEKNHRYK